MPLVKSRYPGPPAFLINGHFETIYAAISRKFPAMGYRRERITLSDGDFLDLDWLESRNRRLAILLHGLEGNSDRPYIKGMAALRPAAGRKPGGRNPAVGNLYNNGCKMK